MSGWLLVCLLAGPIVNAQDQNTFLVDTEQGPVRGYKEADYNLYAFLSIPYATAPTGRDRFKAPLPAPIWTETYDAVAQDVVCPQENLHDPDEQENCLLADVFVPNNNQQNLPVVVSIHGGGFQSGVKNNATLKSFAEQKNVIIVSFNYRLNVHGFLCLGTENAPGNAGMKDQVALLRWVNRNIASFNGNPQDVTIIGCSAGGAAVDLLNISKLTTGLFQKAIVGSSCHLSAYTMQIDPIENVKLHAKTLNFTNVDDLNALEEFYLETPLSVLSVGTSNYVHENILFRFTPCVEVDVGEEVFLDDAPLNIISKGQRPIYPTMYGFTDLEGLLFKNSFDEWKNRMNERFSDFLPSDLKFENDAARDKVARQVKEMYFGKLPVNNNSIQKFFEYYTDVLFAYSMERSVAIQNKAESAATFLLKYSFTDKDSAVIPHTKVFGAIHCEHFFMIADSEQKNLTSKRRTVISVLRDLFYNFIRTGEPVVNGSPVPLWPRVGADRAPVLSIGAKIQLNYTMEDPHYHLWEYIYQRYYRIPSPPKTNTSA